LKDGYVGALLQNHNIQDRILTADEMEEVEAADQDEAASHTVMAEAFVLRFFDCYLKVSMKDFINAVWNAY